jgi:hypothetical protein
MSNPVYEEALNLTRTAAKLEHWLQTNQGGRKNSTWESNLWALATLAASALHYFLREIIRCQIDAINASGEDAGAQAALDLMPPQPASAQDLTRAVYAFLETQQMERDDTGRPQTMDLADIDPSSYADVSLDLSLVSDPPPTPRRKGNGHPFHTWTKLSAEPLGGSSVDDVALRFATQAQRPHELLAVALLPSTEERHFKGAIDYTTLNWKDDEDTVGTYRAILAEELQEAEEQARIEESERDPLSVGQEA